MLDEFADAGIGVVAISSNPEELARKTAEEWRLERLPLGYGLTLEDGRAWGLFTTAAIKDAEPDTFTEPGTFVVRPDGTLYASIVQSMPFTRAPGKELLGGLKWVIENDYPARGELAPTGA